MKPCLFHRSPGCSAIRRSVPLPTPSNGGPARRRDRCVLKKPPENVACDSHGGSQLSKFLSKSPTQFGGNGYRRWNIGHATDYGRFDRNVLSSCRSDDVI